MLADPKLFDRMILNHVFLQQQMQDVVTIKANIGHSRNP